MFPTFMNDVADHQETPLKLFPESFEALRHLYTTRWNFSSSFHNS